MRSAITGCQMASAFIGVGFAGQGRDTLTAMALCHSTSLFPMLMIALARVASNLTSE